MNQNMMIQIEMYLNEYRDSKTATVNKIYEDLKKHCKTYGQLSGEVEMYSEQLRRWSLDAVGRALVEKHKAELNDIPLNNHLATFSITSPLHTEAIVINMIREFQHLNKLKKNVTEGDRHNAETKKDV